MRKFTFILFYLSFSVGVFAQNYNTEKLKVISTIWGETYLFHPSIIRSDKKIEWEKDLVDFLPHIKTINSNDEFMKVVNSELLVKIQDPFTLVQPSNESIPINRTNFNSNKEFDYINITESQLSDIAGLTDIDSMITDRTSKKPLVIDLRIANELVIDYHSNTFFDFFASMLIESEIPSATSVTREHLGWDEYNDWWYYEQRWKVKSMDKQLADNGRIKPFLNYSQEIQQYIPDYNFETFKPIQRPVYLLTNNSFLSYYGSSINSLRSNRQNLFVLNENSGTVFNSENTDLIKYQFDKYEFILNTGFYFDRGNSELTYDLNIHSIQLENVVSFIKAKPVPLTPENRFSFDILVRKYENNNEELSQEEKIMGIIKTWTIVKYFYAHPNLCSIDWENSLGKYLELAQNTSTDKEYYILIQEMMATLNDSHVSTFHPSIIDFSKIFVAPVNFEYIENKVIITAIDSSIQANINPGDEIVSIDGLTIEEILKNEKKTVSSSNNQGFIATVIHPGYFVGAEGSLMKLGIKKGTGQEFIEIPRQTYIFQFWGYGDNREESKIYENNIGYLNLAFLTDAHQLETELIKMQKTKALIIDLRNSYPTADFNHFLQLLCNTKTKIRIDEVPIICAYHKNKRQIQVSDYEIYPDTAFTYTNPIVVLIDKTMISRPEDIAIALKSFSNVIFVGEQTQGTDGEMTKIYLPGGGETSFTGQIVKFGNGENFQRKGILPDIEVHRTIDGVKESKDEILEKALTILNKN